MVLVPYALYSPAELAKPALVFPSRLSSVSAGMQRG
jgi:hypothetical protein